MAERGYRAALRRVNTDASGRRVCPRRLAATSLPSERSFRASRRKRPRTRVETETAPARQPPEISREAASPVTGSVVRPSSYPSAARNEAKRAEHGKKKTRLLVRVVDSGLQCSSLHCPNARCSDRPARVSVRLRRNPPIADHRHPRSEPSPTKYRETIAQRKRRTLVRILAPENRCFRRSTP